MLENLWINTYLEKNISEENAEVIEMENENGTRVVGNGKIAWSIRK